ncbi:MAG: serine hydrolase domain-containing protein [Promethearchaeota archaeon]
MTTLDQTASNTLDKFIRKYMREGKVPGLAISIIQEGDIIYSKGFGARDLDSGLPMTPQTLIGIGSINKSITAMAIMKLVEAGKLGLEDSVAKYLPSPPFSNHPDIQIQHLLSHSTGIPAVDASLIQMFYLFGDYSRVCPFQTRDQFLAHIADAEEFIIFQPGERFFYNNDMYVCLGFIIEDLTEQPYYEFIRLEILNPLEMTDAVYTKKNFENHPTNDRMTGYLPKPQDKKMVPTKSPPPILEDMHAPGGLYVSMEAMMNYAQCLLNKGKYKDVQLITPESLERLWQPIIASPYGYGKNPKYALGWSVEKECIEYPLIHHGGGMGTSCAFFALVPDLNIGISVAQNCCTGNTATVGRAAIALLMGSAPEDQIEDLKYQALLKDICGEYSSAYDMYSMKITQKGGMVHANLEIDDGPLDFPIIVENFDLLRFKIGHSSSTKKVFVQFFRNAHSHKIEFGTFDRYLYKKL